MKLIVSLVHSVLNVLLIQIFIPTSILKESLSILFHCPTAHKNHVNFID